MSSPVVTPPRRRRSMSGPVILIIVGLIFLFGNMHLISWGRLGFPFAHYWPLLLILLAEKLRERGEYTLAGVLAQRFDSPAVRGLAAASSLTVGARPSRWAA